MAKAFNFGQNWKDFSENALNQRSIKQSRVDFERLLNCTDLSGKSFIDIGFGQGLGILNAASMGARVVGCDINPLCREALLSNKALYPEVQIDSIPIVIGSILEMGVVDKIKAESETFDIVHSWGVLHHTGDMKKAIFNAASLTATGGEFIIALYRKHWSSFPWLIIKWVYNILPRFFQMLLVYIMFPVIWLAKLLVTGKNPMKKERGMNFFYDVVDWVGGYPYEYASPAEVKRLIEPLGFKLERDYEPKTPIGCHEYVFKKVIPKPSHSA